MCIYYDILCKSILPGFGNFYHIQGISLIFWTFCVDFCTKLGTKYVKDSVMDRSAGCLAASCGRFDRAGWLIFLFQKDLLNLPNKYVATFTFLFDKGSSRSLEVHKKFHVFSTISIVIFPLFFFSPLILSISFLSSSKN
jgi:hypothetical protein